MSVSRKIVSSLRQDLLIPERQDSPTKPRRVAKKGRKVTDFETLFCLVRSYSRFHIIAALPISLATTVPYTIGALRSTVRQTPTQALSHCTRH
jgi:hypothetical protein